MKSLPVFVTFLLLPCLDKSVYLLYLSCLFLKSPLETSLDDLFGFDNLFVCLLVLVLGAQQLLLLLL